MSRNMRNRSQGHSMLRHSEDMYAGGNKICLKKPFPNLTESTLVQLMSTFKHQCAFLPTVLAARIFWADSDKFDMADYALDERMRQLLKSNGRIREGIFDRPEDSWNHYFFYEDSIIGDVEVEITVLIPLQHLFTNSACPSSRCNGDLPRP